MTFISVVKGMALMSGDLTIPVWEHSLKINVTKFALLKVGCLLSFQSGKLQGMNCLLKLATNELKGLLKLLQSPRQFLRWKLTQKGTSCTLFRTSLLSECTNYPLIKSSSPSIVY